MNEKEVSKKEAADRMQRLLNGDFDRIELGITFSYAEKNVDGMGKEELEKCLKSIKEPYLKQVQNEGAAY